MGKAEAQAYYDPIGGETTGYISPQDAKDAIGLIYDELADRTTIGNLLTDNQASLTSGYSLSNATVSTVADSAALNGSALELTLSGASSGSCLTAYGSTTVQTVSPGDVVTAHAKIKAGTAAGIAAVVYYNSANSVIRVDYGNSVTNTSAYETSQVTSVAPAAAHHLQCRAYSVGGGAGLTFRVDRHGLWMGAGGEWAMPGTPITNLGTKVTHPNTDDVLVQRWDSGLGRWQRVHYDSGVRDVSSLITSPWVAGASCQLRRVNSTIFVALSATTSPTSVANVLTFPTGFKPTANIAYIVGWGSSVHPVSISSSTGIAYPATSLTSLAWTFQFGTSDVIPTSLPGTLASAAPN